MRPRHLVIMAKAPQAGRVKTRLAAAVGPVEALRCYRVLLEETVRRLASDGRWATWLAVTPDEAAPRFAAMRDISIDIIAQGPGGLGDRMQRLMDRLPPGPVVIIGSDIPTIGRGDIASAFRVLGRTDAVFGPADDGGYWLVGLRRTPRILRLFAGVRWSSAHALADTARNVDGDEVSLLSTMADIDDEAGYLRWRRGHGASYNRPGCRR
jgi:rSAM/selenodomain-associated transferase 1